MWKYAEYVYVNPGKWKSIYWLLFVIIHVIKIITTSNLFSESILPLFQKYVKEGREESKRRDGGKGRKQSQIGEEKNMASGNKPTEAQKEANTPLSSVLFRTVLPFKTEGICHRKCDKEGHFPLQIENIHKLVYRGKPTHWQLP